MSMKHTKRKKKMGKKIDPGRVRLGEKMDQLEEYTSLPTELNGIHSGALYFELFVL